MQRTKRHLLSSLSIEPQHHTRLNIDEANSENRHRVLGILCSYYLTEQEKVVIHHLDSVSVISVNSESLFDNFVEVFERHEISWKYLTSIMMDSCSVMRGVLKGHTSSPFTQFRGVES